MKQSPEVFVDFHWTKTVNFILYKLTPNNDFILKSQNNKMSKMFIDSVVNILCDQRGFYKKVKEWKDEKEIKVHLMRVGEVES